MTVTHLRDLLPKRFISVDRIISGQIYGGTRMRSSRMRNARLHIVPVCMCVWGGGGMEVFWPGPRGGGVLWSGLGGGREGGLVTWSQGGGVVTWSGGEVLWPGPRGGGRCCDLVLGGIVTWFWGGRCCDLVPGGRCCDLVHGGREVLWLGPWSPTCPPPKLDRQMPVKT